jgi:hypothetical protein
MASEKAIQEQSTKSAFGDNSVLEDFSKIGASAIVGAVACLALGSRVRGDFSFWWTLLGAILGSALQGWQLRQIRKNR